MSDLSAWAEWVAQSVAQTVARRRCQATATYRMQFAQGKMTFRDAAGIVPYLDELGVSHLYASPYLKARRGSPHGYAIVDYGQLDPELGSESDYEAMVTALHGHGMGQILDVVPNHMSATPAENLWWNDVLENGPASPHAAYFDIDWRPVQEGLRNKILLPVLRDQYGQVLESGELKLEYREGAFFLRCGQSLLPIEPRSYRTILARGLDALKQSQPPDSEDIRELESILTALAHLPEAAESDPHRAAERQREKEVVKGRLAVLTDRAATVAEFVCRNVQELNGRPEDPHSYDGLDELLEAQVYRLSHWKAAADEINYRRFFDINDLAAVCTEAPEVFAESHRLIFELLVRGDVNGLRVDHIDGLYDPTEYLRRLQRGFLVALGKALYCSFQETGNVGQVANLPEAEQIGNLPHLPGTEQIGNLPHLPGTEQIGNLPHLPGTEQIGNLPHMPWSEIEPEFLPRVTELTCLGLRRPAAVRGGGKDPRRRGIAAGRLVAGGHDGLRFFELRGWVVRRPVRRGGTGQDL